MKYLTEEWLLRHDACPTALDEFRGKHPTCKALISDVVRALEEREDVDWLQWLMIQDVAILKSILNLGVSFNCVGEDDYTLLMCAVFDQKENVVKHLISLGVDLDAKSSDGGTVMRTAEWRTRRLEESPFASKVARRIINILKKAGAK